MLGLSAILGLQNVACRSHGFYDRFTRTIRLAWKDIATQVQIMKVNTTTTFYAPLLLYHLSHYPYQCILIASVPTCHLHLRVTCQV